MTLFSAAPVISLDNVTVGFDICLPYQVLGYPMPTITWQKNGETLDLPTVSIEDRPLLIAEYLIRGCLSFLTHKHTDNGNYTLIATNIYGTSNNTRSAVMLNGPGKNKDNK